ncbi:DUF6719 family protein [Fulvimarina sp. 2208YS6-2-32]|uniref:DUF6719 family protein n=1 Tax=Fulvimarina uroteuthidis TaxID=3098149 RepID=A0ABU5I8R6_9HYPH|nr:DUF6719 family protein [Fulvimarina sp. 2208YS6-2-32]MDY8111188.1 DUF6719 family protein [Fulvimarina sp. 2208YS6-2-32]
MTAVFTALALTGCQQTVRTTEPPAGTLAYGSTVLVDDGTCPAGQIKQVTGGNNARGIARKNDCVARP